MNAKEVIAEFLGASFIEDATIKGIAHAIVDALTAHGFVLVEREPCSACEGTGTRASVLRGEVTSNLPSQGVPCPDCQDGYREGVWIDRAGVVATYFTLFNFRTRS